jgi:hypothetical protein
MSADRQHKGKEKKSILKTKDVSIFLEAEKKRSCGHYYLKLKITWRQQSTWKFESYRPRSENWCGDCAKFRCNIYNSKDKTKCIKPDPENLILHMCYITDSSTNIRHELAILRMRTVVIFRKRIHHDWFRISIQ